MNLAFEISKKTILQAQSSLGVTSNNIANSKVEGYTRQNANIRTSMSIKQNNNLYGTGAEIASIDRMRTGFYDKQYRDNLSIYSNAETTTTAYTRLESFFGTLDGDTGLKTSMNTFFNSLEELAKYPENISIKNVVKDSGYAMAQSFNLIANNLGTMREQYVSHTEDKVNEINENLRNFQTVNEQISKLTALGQQPNDLLDERDRILDSLSQSMDINIIEGKDNKINLISSGHILVQDTVLNELKYSSNPAGEVSVTYSRGDEFKSHNGELSALIEISNSIIPKHQDDINSFANEFVVAYNAIHSTGINTGGVTGINFFEGSNASNIKVSEDIIRDPSLIMTSSDGTAGNNEIALKLVELKDEKVMGNGGYNVIEYYDKIALEVSANTKTSAVKTANYKYITDEIYVMRSNEVGVNEDEELVSAIKIQQTFAAASRILSTLTEMFDSLISAI